jgi:hypothetical protein
LLFIKLSLQGIIYLFTNNNMLARLTKFIECWHINWVHKVLLCFQLCEIDVPPKDTSKPVYKQFAKTPYWWLLSYRDEAYKSICDALWSEYDISLADKVWELLEVEIQEWEYQGKKTYTIVWCSKADSVDVFERWVDPQVFKWSPETTLEDIQALWYENKHVKTSKEFSALVPEDF